MSWLIATFKVQDGKQAEFEAVMNPLVEKVRAQEPGTLIYSLVKSKKDPTQYLMVERYRSDDDRKAHGQTDYFKQAADKFMALLAEPPQLNSLVDVSA